MSIGNFKDVWLDNDLLAIFDVQFFRLEVLSVQIHLRQSALIHAQEFVVTIENQSQGLARVLEHGGFNVGIRVVIEHQGKRLWITEADSIAVLFHGVPFLFGFQRGLILQIEASLSWTFGLGFCDQVPYERIGLA